jgi:hypothetical protein
MRDPEAGSMARGRRKGGQAAHREWCWDSVRSGRQNRVGGFTGLLASVES